MGFMVNGVLRNIQPEIDGQDFVTMLSNNRISSGTLEVYGQDIGIIP